MGPGALGGATRTKPRGDIATLPPPLTEGEAELLEALMATLDDSWTIYVQPHLNGLRPDFVVFSRTPAIGIIEVKDRIFQDTQVDITEDDHVRWRVRGAAREWQELLRESGRSGREVLSDTS